MMLSKVSRRLAFLRCCHRMGLSGRYDQRPGLNGVKCVFCSTLIEHFNAFAM